MTETDAGDASAARRQRRTPDYQFEQDMLELVTPEQFKAMGDPLRQRIIGLLRERAATTSQLAQVLDCPIGTMGHHLHVLLDAGLIHVVRTRQVRAMTEKYYGLRARAFYSMSERQRTRQFQQALGEWAPVEGEGLPLHILRHARIPRDRAQQFARQVYDLAMEFDEGARAGEPVWGFLAAVYLTDWPELPPAE